ncbi:MAG: F0F1 ATP synthase subunit B [Alphaproteobacteria bacterium]|nr:F0F1 ATP synthase subunit B [Alphaproteobacteria bacterium]
MASPATQEAGSLIAETEKAMGDAGYGAFYLDPTFWVAVSFVLFIGVLLYYKVPKMINERLDSRAEAIKAQLEEARKLREEAQALLASYQRRQRDAEKEAGEIIEHAEEEAKRTVEQAKTQLQESLERREQLAKEKIAQAEASAVQQVRLTAVDVATAVSRRLIAEGLDEQASKALVDEAIENLPKHLH